jgi:hypothetical protein
LGKTTRFGGENTPGPILAQIGPTQTMNVNVVNRFNRRDTQFRQPWIGRENWRLRFGDGGSVPDYERWPRLSSKLQPKL